MHMELAWFTQEKRRNRGKSSTTSHGHTHQPHGFLAFKKKERRTPHISSAYDIRNKARSTQRTEQHPGRRIRLGSTIQDRI